MNPSVVLGYHGCSTATADKVLSSRSGVHLKTSRSSSEWLGNGIYFWENSYDRALLWAKDKCKRSGEKPDVIGAVIIPGECLDLTDSAYLRALEKISGSFEKIYLAEHAKPVPQNNLGRNYHAYDCALINFFRKTMEELNGRRFNTVRAAFNEGGSIAGSSFSTLNHIQWAVLTPEESIIGYFRPTMYHLTHHGRCD